MRGATKAGTPPERDGPIIEVAGLRKSYPAGAGTLRVLWDLSLVVPRGEMLAVLGVSGVGKTTLLNVLGLMDRPEAGSYRFGGRDVLGLDEGGRARFRNVRCGFVFQAHHLLPEFDAVENAALPLLIRRVPHREALRRAAEVLERLGMGGRLDHRPAQLSGGEQQRVALARAFAGRPELVLADEPTGNLDPQTAEVVFRLFREFHEEAGTTTVLVTHSTDLAGLCDRSLRLAGGLLV